MINERGNFAHATRRLLFPEVEKTSIPGSGQSAARIPRRHTRVKVTMNLDGDLVEHFKEKAAEVGVGYQQLINQVLREHAEGSTPERLAREVGKILLENEMFLGTLATSLKP